MVAVPFDSPNDTTSVVFATVTTEESMFRRGIAFASIVLMSAVVISYSIPLTDPSFQEARQ